MSDPAANIDDLPKQYDHAAAQERWTRIWDDKNLFHAVPDGRRPFSIVIPPPNVTGALHLGHALNNTLQDVIVRYKRMAGWNALWMPGTDHAGIATQAVVERRLLSEEKLSRHDLGREKLVERIWKWKEQYEARILGQLKQMGCSCDWRRTRFTLDDQCARAVRHTFFRMFKDRLIYRGKRLVNWDTFLQTAVSDDEVFHEAVKGHFWHFHYPVIDPKPGEPTHVTIATTRPETMLGDTAVAVHPDPESALARAEAQLHEKRADAPERERAAIDVQIQDVAERRKTLLPRLIQLRDMALDGRQLMLPLVDREIPLVADEWAKPELGSGCVKITPAHDPNDYEVGLRQRLPMINILNADGTLNAAAGEYQGMTIRTARERVVADMDDRELLFEVEDRDIDLAHSDRSKTPIEPFLADQWFVKMDDLAQSAMDAVNDGRVKIAPARYAKGYIDWLSEKRDWPVSRQLWWGHRIPIWSQSVDKQADADRLLAALKNDPEVKAGRVAYQVEIDEERQTAAALDDTVHGASKVTIPYGAVQVCIRDDDEDLAARFESQGYERDSDVLDTWFSSALWPHSTLGWPDETPELKYYYPTSALITSRDIITLWVARMVLTGLYNLGEAPFSRVFIHPKILDGYGETMSKSKGNGVDPLDVIEKFGADALRFALAFMATETQDVRMPVEFECPHCQASVAQTKKNRELPKVACPKCKGEFSTQWATTDADKALPRGAVISERFELARNFCNKLWNASRFALMNLEGYEVDVVAADELTVEDRWLLSRLSTVAEQATEAIEQFKYSEAARTLYDFAWDEFCSFYVEMAKNRLADPAARPAAQRILAHALDVLLRLLHPITPFITEEVWRLLNQAAPKRGLSKLVAPTEQIAIAPWPDVEAERQDAQIESQFRHFQTVLAALRDIRSRNNIPPKTPIEFSIRCDEEMSRLLQPMAPYFDSMAGARAVAWGAEVVAPLVSGSASLPGADVYVDLKDVIDVEAEIQRQESQLDKLKKLSEAKQRKLENPQFTDRAPQDVVRQEREGSQQLLSQIESIHESIAALRAMSLKSK